MHIVKSRSIAGRDFYSLLQQKARYIKALLFRGNVYSLRDPKATAP